MTSKISRVYGPRDYTTRSQAADSSCFYFQEIDIGEMFTGRVGVVGRFARIEVSDQEGPLHQHPGTTFVIVTAGAGRLKTIYGDRRIRAGDMVFIPPMTPHLSVADSGSVMIEHIVYLGKPGDVQTLLVCDDE